MSERLSIHRAAKAVHIRREKIRQWIEERKLTAYQRGGSDKRPLLEVELEELKKVKDRETVYVPLAFRADEAKRVHRRRPGRRPHPLANLM